MEIDFLRFVLLDQKYGISLGPATSTPTQAHSMHAWRGYLFYLTSNHLYAARIDDATLTGRHGFAPIRAFDGDKPLLGLLVSGNAVTVFDQEGWWVMECHGLCAGAAGDVPVGKQSVPTGEKIRRVSAMAVLTESGRCFERVGLLPLDHKTPIIDIDTEYVLDKEGIWQIHNGDKLRLVACCAVPGFEAQSLHVLNADKRLFAVGLCDGHEYNLAVCHVDAGSGHAEVTNLGNVTSAFVDSSRSGHYSVHHFNSYGDNVHDLLVIAHSASIRLGLAGRLDHSPTWTTMEITTDEYTADMPLSADADDTFPVALTVDLHNTYQYKVPDDRVEVLEYPPYPIVLARTTDNRLVPFALVNVNCLEQLTVVEPVVGVVEAGASPQVLPGFLVTSSESTMSSRVGDDGEVGKHPIVVVSDESAVQDTSVVSVQDTSVVYEEPAAQHATVVSEEPLDTVVASEKPQDTSEEPVLQEAEITFELQEEFTAIRGTVPQKELSAAKDITAQKAVFNAEEPASNEEQSAVDEKVQEEIKVQKEVIATEESAMQVSFEESLTKDTNNNEVADLAATIDADASKVEESEKEETEAEKNQHKDIPQEAPKELEPKAIDTVEIVKAEEMPSEEPKEEMIEIVEESEVESLKEAGEKVPTETIKAVEEVKEDKKEQSFDMPSPIVVEIEPEEPQTPSDIVKQRDSDDKGKDKQVEQPVKILFDTLPKIEGSGIEAVIAEPKSEVSGSEKPAPKPESVISETKASKSEEDKVKSPFASLFGKPAIENPTEPIIVDTKPDIFAETKPKIIAESQDQPKTDAPKPAPFSFKLDSSPLFGATTTSSKPKPATQSTMFSPKPTETTAPKPTESTTPKPTEPIMPTVPASLFSSKTTEATKPTIPAKPKAEPSSAITSEPVVQRDKQPKAPEYETINFTPKQNTIMKAFLDMHTQHHQNMTRIKESVGSLQRQLSSLKRTDVQAFKQALERKEQQRAKLTESAEQLQRLSARVQTLRIAMKSNSKLQNAFAENKTALEESVERLVAYYSYCKAVCRERECVEPSTLQELQAAAQERVCAAVSLLNECLSSLALTDAAPVSVPSVNKWGELRKVLGRRKVELRSVNERPGVAVTVKVVETPQEVVGGLSKIAPLPRLSQTAVGRSVSVGVENATPPPSLDVDIAVVAPVERKPEPASKPMVVPGAPVERKPEAAVGKPETLPFNGLSFGSTFATTTAPVPSLFALPPVKLSAPAVTEESPISSPLVTPSRPSAATATTTTTSSPIQAQPATSESTFKFGQSSGFTSILPTAAVGASGTTGGFAAFANPPSSGGGFAPGPAPSTGGFAAFASAPTSTGGFAAFATPTSNTQPQPEQKPKLPNSFTQFRG